MLLFDINEKPFHRIDPSGDKGIASCISPGWEFPAHKDISQRFDHNHTVNVPSGAIPCARKRYVCHLQLEKILPLSINFGNLLYFTNPYSIVDELKSMVPLAQFEDFEIVSS